LLGYVSVNCELVSCYATLVPTVNQSVAALR